MKNILLLLVLLSTTLAINAQDNLSDYDKSLKSFEAGKKLHQNSYEYTIGVALGGAYSPSYKVKIIVKNGEIVERGFKSYKERFKKMNGFWEEEGDMIGQHKNYHLQTLDEVYQKVKTLIDPTQKEASKYDFYLENQHEGILSKGGKQKKNCRSNCFDGYEILYFKWL